jgi:hypothetical protein
VSAASIQLIGPDGLPVTPINIQFRQQDREVQLTYDTLAVGAQELTLVGPVITDRVGNPLGANDVTINFTIENFSVEWVGAPNGFWDTPTNWSTGVVPTATDDVYISPDAGTVTYRTGTTSVATLTSDAALKVTGGALSIAGESELRNGVQLPGGTLTLDGDTTVGGELQLSGGTLVANGALDVAGLDMSAGTIGGTGTIGVAGASTWSGGMLTDAGIINFNGDLAISGAANKYLLGGRVVNTLGTTTWSGATAVNTNDFYTGPATINNSGTWIDANAFSTIIRDYYSGAPLVFNNVGSYLKEGAATSTLEVVFDNTGTVDVQAGVLSLSNGGTAGAQGSINIEPAATLRFSTGAFTLDDTTVTGTGTFEVAGTYNTTTNVIHTGTTTLGGTLLLTGGTLTANGTLTAASYAQTGGNSVLTGTGTVSIAGAGTWSAGTLRGTGSIDFDGDLVITGNGDKYIFDGRVINLNATTTWSGNTGSNNNELWFGTGTLNNNGTFVDANAFSARMLNYYAGTLVFNNTGSYLKEGAATSTLEVVFDNTGTVDVQAGVLSLSSGGTSTGAAAIASAAELALTGGTFTWSAGASVSGTGLLSVRGTLALDTDVSVEHFNLGAGALTGTATLTITSTGSQWTGGTMTGGGTIEIASGADLTIAGNLRKHLGDRMILNEGTLIEASSGDLVDLDGAAILNNVGIFDIQGNTAWQDYAGAAGTLTLNNSGTLTKSAGTGQFEFLNTALNNSGTVDVQSGTLAFGGSGGVSTGVFTTAAGTEVAFLSGTQTWSDGVQATGDGAIAVRNLNSGTGGTLNVDGGVEVARFDLGYLGTLTGTGTLTITGTGSQWTGGTMTGGGTTEIAAGGDLTVAGNLRKHLGDRTIVNEGTLIEASTGDLVDLDGAAILNNIGIFDIQSDTAWKNYAGAAGTLTLNNSGTITKSAGTGTFTFANTTFNNTGVVTVTSGVLDIAGTIFTT